MQSDSPSDEHARGHHLPRTFGKVALACGAGALLLGVLPAFAGTIVTDTVVNQSTAAQTNVPITFGQVFKDGDVPSGAKLTATLNGQPVALQVDPKATNPDGSLRHAVLTAMVPSLAAAAKLPLTLSTGATLPAGAPVTLSQLLATHYDAAASFNIGGKTYSIDARGLLQAADIAAACRPWGTQCNTWLSGPLVSAWVVNGPVTAADGSTNPHLRVYFAVRAYAGTTPGTVSLVRTDIIVENSNAYAPQGQPQYTATLTSGSASYTSPALTQYAYTRWHHDLWWNNVQPQVYLQQDTQYIQASGAVSRYMALTPDASFLAGLRQTCAPLDYCDQTKTMGNTGAQPAIGPLPRWTSVYIIDPGVRAYNWMLANTDALGAYSIHYRDPATGWPVSIQKHPYVTIIDWAYANTVAKQNSSKGAQYRADLLPNCVNNSVVTDCNTGWYGTGNPDTWDNEHQPAESFVPYMVTGSYYYMSELAFGASQNEIWSNEAYRGFAQGLIDASHATPRGKAWTLRNMANAAWLLPDGYPLKAEFNADVENALADLNATYTDNPDANPLHVMPSGVVYSVNGGNKDGMPPWQHNFLTWSAGHAAELGFAGAAEFRNWLAQFEIGLMTDWQRNPDGFCWLEASTYTLQVKDTSGNWLPSYTAAYAATFPTLSGLSCNSAGMVTAMAKLPGNPKPGHIGEMYGYAYSATGYPANFQIALATAVDSGLPNAGAAWQLFDSRSAKPVSPMAYNDYPNFAIIPRSAPSGAPISPTEPDPTQPGNPPPPPVQPPPPPPQPPASGGAWPVQPTTQTTPSSPAPAGNGNSPAGETTSPAPEVATQPAAVRPSPNSTSVRDSGFEPGWEFRLGLTLRSGVFRAARYFQMMLPQFFSMSAPGNVVARSTSLNKRQVTSSTPPAGRISKDRGAGVPIATTAASRPILLPKRSVCEASERLASVHAPAGRQLAQQQIIGCEALSAR